MDAAIAALEAIERLIEGSGLEEPTLVPWAPDLVEAYVRSGRSDDARRVLAMLDRQADSTGTDYPRLAAARCRGMLADDFDEPFAAALALHDRCPLPFERARTLLALGRRLHRGATNREIAAELFLAPKTVAFHLREIYRKQGVRSRTQLIAKLAREGGADGDPTPPAAATAAPRAGRPRSS